MLLVVIVVAVLGAVIAFVTINVRSNAKKSSVAVGPFKTLFKQLINHLQTVSARCWLSERLASTICQFMPFTF